MRKDNFTVRISILHKTMLYVVLLVSVTVGISTYLAVRAESRVLTERLIHTGRHLARNIASSTKSAFWSLNWIFVEKLLRESVQCDPHEITYIKIVNPDHEVYLANDKAYYGEMIDSPLLFDQETLLDNHFFPKAKEQGYLLVHPIEIGNDRWYVIVGLSLRPVTTAIRDLIIRNLEFGGLIILLGVVGSLFLSKSISKPIINLAKAAKVISGGGWHNVQVESKDEVGLLGHSFNQMVKNLKQGEEEIKNYSLNLEKMVEERTSELKKALSNLQETQSQLLQSEKMASIGQLASGVAHEINNPIGFINSNLGSLKGYLEDLSRLIRTYEELKKDISTSLKGEKNEKFLTLLEAIDQCKEEIDYEFVMNDLDKLISESQEGTERVKKIVADLKDFAHVDAPDLQYADINKCIESTLNIVRNELKYKTTVTKDLGDLPEIYCYPNKLNQVFMNVLVNAAQAIEKRGEIRISTRLCNGDGPCVEIQISDTGSGIPEDDLPRIFDPFFTTKPVGTGTGLGLNMAYGIIKKHHGRIYVESEVGKGTTFTIVLPVRDEG